MTRPIRLLLILIGAVVAVPSPVGSVVLLEKAVGRFKKSGQAAQAEKPEKVCVACCAFTSTNGPESSYLWRFGHQDTLMKFEKGEGLVPCRVKDPKSDDFYVGKGNIERAYPASIVHLLRSYTDEQGEMLRFVEGFANFRGGEAAILPLLRAECMILVRGKGQCATESADPFTAVPGVYDEAPTLDSLILINRDTRPGSRVLLHFDTESSLDSAGLWSLDLTLLGDHTLEIDFSSSPLLGLNEQDVIDDLLDALDRTSPDSVALSPAYFNSGYTLFNRTLSSPNHFSYAYSIRALSLTGDTTVVGVPTKPSRHELAVETPVMHAPWIQLLFAEPTEADLRIYDAKGRLIRNLSPRREFPAGPQRMVWDRADEDGRFVAPGVYFLRLQGRGFVIDKRVVLIG